jgi:hypothetical protein
MAACVESHSEHRTAASQWVHSTPTGYSSSPPGCSLDDGQCFHIKSISRQFTAIREYTGGRICHKPISYYYYY